MLHCQFRRFSFFGFTLSLVATMTVLMGELLRAFVVATALGELCTMASSRETPLYLYSQCNVSGLSLLFLDPLLTS